MFPCQICRTSVSDPSEVTRSVELEDVIFIITSVKWSLEIISDKVAQVRGFHCCNVLAKVSGGVLVTR